MKETKNKRLRLFFIIFLSLSFIGSVSWYWFAKYSARNIVQRFISETEYLYKNIETKGVRTEFVNGSLVFWQDNTVPFDLQDSSFNAVSYGSGIIQELKNGIYLHKQTFRNDTAVHYFYLIKHKYPVTNAYLDNTFNPPYDLDKQIEVVNYKTDIPVQYQGKTICYLDASPECLDISDKDLFVFRVWMVLNVFLLTVFASSFVDFKTTDRVLKILILAFMYAVFVFITVMLCRNNGGISFRLFSQHINYDNILLFTVITLLGFILYMIAVKICGIKRREKYYLALQFTIILIASITAGSIVEFYAAQNKDRRIENFARRLIDTNTAEDAGTFNTLMQASVKDSAVQALIRANRCALSEQYIDRYYLSLLKDNNHTNVLVFSAEDSMTLRPDNRPTNISAYTENRMKNTVKSEKDSCLFIENEHQNNCTYIYYTKTGNAYVFAECLRKENSDNMNYSLFLSTDKNQNRDLSWAKYSDNSLLYSYGERNFPDTITNDADGWKKNTDYDLYRLKQGNTVYLVSSEKYSLYKAIGSISVFFLLLSIILGCEYLFAALFKAKNHTVNIKSKILLSLLGSFIISLVILGFFSIRSMITLNERNNINNLKEKTVSLQPEIESLLAGEGAINESDAINLSNIFLTDINIFDTDGKLITSSRPEIFEKGILSRRMDKHAFEKMHNGAMKFFYQKESIAGNGFFASYCPVTANNTTVYLNIPFINQQQTSFDNINSLINSFANMFLFWVNIAVVIFVALSNLITKPLELVKEKISVIDIDSHNDKITWNKDDEMGQLIRAYNIMVDKIEASSLLLKQQERLSSWRELAKQVAHDIKNPLTPMKLSIQYLQKLYNEKPELFETKWKEISPSLIAQIDTVSNITQELNSYGRPTVKKEKVDLNKCIASAISLFANSQQVSITYTACENCFVTGEEKLFIRIFNNMIKNSVQALYNKDNGRIHIQIKPSKDKFTVSIADNGCGIKDENKSKIFDTRFTTKSDGGGIGLTIVKTILESYNASVEFKSKENVGTVFFITLPAYQDKQEEK
ncbi:MAG: HAMP domain-containing histidine kinase [Bacteroidales bacterium]|nr:HAMP domain-containing histidine kinase [Bacteroidales bacterium]